MSKHNEPKIAEVIAAIAAEVKMDEVAIRKEIKERKIRSFKKVAEFVAEWKAAQPIVKARRTRKIRTEVKVHEAGPRGFTFGKVWNASVAAGTGVALHPINRAKLNAQAETLGINFSVLTAAEVAEEIAARF